MDSTMLVPPTGEWIHASATSCSSEACRDVQSVSSTKAEAECRTGRDGTGLLFNSITQGGVHWTLEWEWQPNH